METASGTTPVPPFGEGWWRVIEAQGLPGAVEGDVIQVHRVEQWWIFFKPPIGQIGTAEVAGTLDGHEDDKVVVTNAKDALRLVLVPSTGADGAANPVLPWGSGEPPATLTRVYKGKPEAAALLMREDAARLERWGYIAASQHYAEGEWGCGAWVVAALLLVILLGILVVAYMIAVHPEGTLTVVYERRLPASSASAAPTGPAALAATAAVSSAPPPSVEDRLRQLNDLRDKGLITDEEYASKRAAILADL